MVPPPVDVAFAEFRRGNPEALGWVFERVATQLFAHALRQLGNRDSANDAVQATFLALLERRESFRPGAAPLPWMFGVLRNEIHRIRTRSRRREDLAVEPDRPDELSPDPEAAGMAAELSSRVDAVIDTLPESFAEVLRLHLSQGLTPTEIALRLERPAGSVRTQLNRGLKRLRSALPKSLLPWAAGLALSARVLPATRQVLLQRPIAGLGGGLSAGSWLLRLAAVLLLGVAAVFAWQALGTATGSSKAEAAAKPAAAHTDAGGSPPAAGAKLRGGTRERLADGFQLRGRLVDPLTGDGIAAAEVVLRHRLEEGETEASFLLEHSRVPELEEVRGKSDAGGYFRLELPIRKHLGLAAEFTHEDRLRLLGSWSADTDLGEIVVPFPRVIRVRARIQNREGEPIRSAPLRFQREEDLLPDFPPGVRAPATHNIYYVDDAVSVLRLARQARFSLFCVTARLQAGSEALRTPNRAWMDLDITLDTMDPKLRMAGRSDGTDQIRGRLLDAAGSALAGGTATIFLDGRIHRGQHCTADRDGNFVAALDLGARQANRLEVEFSSPGFVTSERIRIAPGMDLGAVHLRRLTLLRVRLLDEHGAPTADYVLWQRSADGLAANTNRTVTAADVDAAGWAKVAALSHGRLSLYAIQNRSGTPVRTPARTVELGEAPAPEIELRLPSTASTAVELVDEAGAPVAGIQAQLIQGSERGTFDWTRCTVAPPILGKSKPRRRLLLGNGTSSADGRLSFRVPQGISAELLILGPGCVPQAVKLERPAGQHRIEVQRGAILRGRVTNLDLVGRYITHPDAGPKLPDFDAESRHVGGRPSLRLVPRGQERRPLAESFPRVFPYRVHPDDQGRYEIEGVPPGAYTLELMVGYQQPSKLLYAPLGEVRITSGRREVRLVTDASHLNPGRLHGRVFDAGEPLANCLIRINREPDQDQPGLRVRAQLDNRGCFDQELLPGRYWFEVIKDNISGTRVALPCEGTFAVSSRTATAALLRAPERRISLRILDAADQALTGVTVELRGVRGFKTIRRENSLGQVESLVPAGPLTVVLLRAKQVARVTKSKAPRWDLSADEGSGPTTLRLPE